MSQSFICKHFNSYLCDQTIVTNYIFAQNMQLPCMCAYSWRQRPACSSETDHDCLDAVVVDDHDVDCGDCDDDNHRYDNNRL